MRAVVLLALVMCAAVAHADGEVAAAAGATEAQADATVAAAANVAAVAETEATAAAAAETSTETAAAAEASTETAAAAAAEATTEAAAAAATEVSAEKPSDKKKDDKKSKATFKPVMIHRHSRRAMRSQRNDIRYTDGGRAPILTFGPGPRDTRVEAEIAVASPLRRRFARWADAISQNKEQYFTAPYADDRYTSFVPSRAFFAPRRPTHFEPEYADEHRTLTALENFQNLQNGDWSPFYAVINGARRPEPTHFEPEYEGEHAIATALENGIPVPVPMIFGDYDFDGVVPFDVEDALEYQRSVYPRAGPRARPSSWQLYGLPEFPEMPASAARHIASTAAGAVAGQAMGMGMAAALRESDGIDAFPPFSGLDDPTSSRVPSEFALGASISYPTGSGAVASLAKLDFALERLTTLNAQLKAAEAKIAASRLRQAEAQDKLQRLNRVRANLQKLAAQIASFEAKVGQDRNVQAEVAKVVSVDSVNGVPVLGSWLGDRIRWNN